MRLTERGLKEIKSSIDVRLAKRHSEIAMFFDPSTFSEKSKQRKMKKPPLKPILLFLFITLVIIVPFCLWGTAIDAWFASQRELAALHREETALLLFGFLATDIVLPIPSSLVSTCCGLFLGFTFGFFVSFMAMNVSAALGYLLGRFFSRTAANLIGERDQNLLEGFARNNARWLLLLLRPVPVLAEASVLFSGIARQPIPRVVGEILLGNAVVSAVYAAVGACGKSANSMLPAFIATMSVSGICLLIGKWRRRDVTELATEHLNS